VTKKEKRSLFSRVFGSNNSTTAPSTATQMYFLNGYKSQFTNYDGRFYDDTDIRSCVDAIARNGAKLNPIHIRNGKKGFEKVNGNLQMLLSKRPNELQNAYKFRYQVISELELYNNSIIYILKDENLKVGFLLDCTYQHNHVKKGHGNKNFKYFLNSKKHYCYKYLKIKWYQKILLGIFDFIGYMEEKIICVIFK